MKEKLYIFDTTLRDGAQTYGVDFNVDEKKLLAQKLDELGVDYIEGGWPGANSTDTKFFNEDLKLYNNGSNSLNSYSVRTKVIKINGVTDSGDKQFYWYCVETGTVYDYDLHYVVGKVKKDENDIIEKINDNTYKIDVIEIPDM